MIPDEEEQKRKIGSLDDDPTIMQRNRKNKNIDSNETSMTFMAAT